MQNDRKNLSERLLDFGASIVRLIIRLEKTYQDDTLVTS
jgi:hypothetical protein